MARVVLVNLLVFLLPFLVYGAYASLAREAATPESIWKSAPVLPLFLAGAVLVALIMFTFATFSGNDSSNGRYEPPVFKDGKIEPGHIR